MTWGEFKKKVEDRGVGDSYEIDAMFGQGFDNIKVILGPHVLEFCIEEADE